jgi:hypothetical protein
VRLSDIVKGGERPGRTPAPGAGERPDTQVPRERPWSPPTVREAPREAAGAEGASVTPPPDRETPVARPAPGLPDRGAPPGGPRADATQVVFQTAVERIRQSLAVRAQAPVSIAQAGDAVDLLLQSLETSDALLSSFFGAGDGAANPARRAVNVCILALKMGLELGYAAEELRALGLAALLCDVGTGLVPPEMLNHADPLTAKDRSALREHQIEGAAQLQKLAPEFRWLGEVIRRRYENPDGPHHPENRFEEYAAIIHLAEVYKSLVHPRAPRKRAAPLEALKEILQRHRATFPDRILKALIRAMSTFPVGSLVRLNTGDVGRVVERNKDFPLRPVVEIIVRRGQRLGVPVSIDLAQSPLVHIKESVLEEALP